MNWFKRKITTPEDAAAFMEKHKPRYPRAMYGCCPICRFERLIDCPSEAMVEGYTNYVNGLCGTCENSMKHLTPILKKIINETLDEREKNKL